MLKIVRFKSPESLEIAEEMAKKVQSHLYHVTRDKNELKFLKFDEPAFNCVLKLEGINRQNYVFVEAKNERLGVAPIYLGEPWIILELTIGNVSRTVCHHFRLLVCNTFQPSEGMNEIPLVINSDLLFFATLIKRIAENILDPISMIDQVTSAVCMRDCLDPPASRILKIERNGETQLYRFFPTELTIHWEWERL